MEVNWYSAGPVSLPILISRTRVPPLGYTGAEARRTTVSARWLHTSGVFFATPAAATLSSAVAVRKMPCGNLTVPPSIGEPAEWCTLTWA
jgi:hypothetical protein